MEQLLEATTTLVIEDDSNTLLYQQRLTSHRDKKVERDALEGFLNRHDEELKRQIALFAMLRDQNRLLRHYFQNLKTLATKDASASAAQAVEGLSSAINSANGVIKNSTPNVVITDDEREAITSLAGLAAKGVQARMLKEALKRDSAIVDEQLLLHEKLMAILADILKHSAEKRYVTDRKTRIVRPYKNKAIDDVEAWKQARKELMLSAFHSEALDRAVLAARQMRLVWRNIVENKTSLASVNLLITDLNELVATTELIQKARMED
jgi:hypothetical protein